MASSSTSSVPKIFKYDVFLSFRGEDTRTNFTDHLYDALKRKGIFTYKDDEAIRKGNLISDDLIQSIEDSRFYIIVFSKNYASSRWCLDELVKIMECQKTTEHTAYPVFYDVEPTEVRKQIGAVGKAFAKHKRDKAARRWKEALKEAADLAGWELKKTANGREAEFIRIIVEDVSKCLPSNNYCFDEKLVGMETRVKNVISYLETDIDDVTMVGIKGIGGGGKTTLARVVFDQISFQFEGISFVENVREISKASVYGLASLQNIILKNVLYDQNINVSSVYDGINMMKRTMNSRKVLLVLDDVDDIEQLKVLAGDRSWFKKGSRIIITTRDENVLLAHGVNWVHNVNLLSSDEAICLFSRLAFKRDVPIQGYEELSTQVVAYASGLPLTITVLGSHLCDKDLDEWKDALERLKTIPLEKTLQKLELSFLSLPEDRKNIFLNVACILKGWEKDLAIEALESCGFHAKIGLKDLQQKSLITIYYDYNQRQRLGMHDHLEEMGKNIVRRSDPEEPKKHSRLWFGEEIKDILANDLGTEATQYMRLNSKEVNLEIVMKGIRKMQKLRFFYVFFRPYYGEQKYDLDNQYLPNSLRYLHWYGYPFCCLPNTFQGDNLVALNMCRSKILQLWEGEERKVLSKLKVLDLRHSNLTIVDLGLIPNVEVLNLGGCSGLVQFHTHHGSLKLKYVNLSDSKLETVDLRSALDLEMLHLKGCYALVKLHLPTDGCPKLKHVDLSNSKRLDTVDLRSALDLEMLHLKGCYALVKLHLPTDGCPKLKHVDLSNSKRLDTVDLRSALDLEMLHLTTCYALVKLHLPVDGCLKLTQLHCTGSKLANLDLALSPNLERLNLNQNKYLVRLHMPGKCQNLRSLELTNSKLTILNLGQTPNLEHLNLNKCYNLEELLMAEKCEKLVSLDISYSKLKTFDLGLTPNITRLDLKDCNNLVRLHVPVGCLENIDHLVLSGCLWFTYFEYEKGPMHSTYKYFDLDQSLGLHLIAERLERCPLHPESTLPKFRFKCFFKHNPPSTRNLETLISDGLCACTNLETFSGSICELDRLIELELEYYPEAPKNLSQLECLEKLIFSKTNMKHLPDGICRLKHLKILHLQSCWRLEKLPDDVGGLECLEVLRLSSPKIKHLPDSICKLKHLIYLTLDDCFKLENLPKDLGQLECLEELYLSHTKIKHLPDSICRLKHLKILQLKSCWRLEKLPDDVGGLECLEVLRLSSSKIKHLPDSICKLKHLIYLTLDDCFKLENLPKDLGQLECLEELYLSHTKIKHLPDSLCLLKTLKRLTLLGCSLLESVPANFGQLKCLTSLLVSSPKIKHLPDTFCMLKYLKKS